MKEIKLYYCEESKTFLLDFGDSSAQCRCEGLKLLEPNLVDASEEKHIPVLSVSERGVSVKVGSRLHPMQPDHLIEWIFVQTDNGGIYRKLQTGDQPKADFLVRTDEVLGVYAYCNLHGLWKAPRTIAAESREHLWPAGFTQTATG